MQLQIAPELRDSVRRIIRQSDESVVLPPPSPPALNTAGLERTVYCPRCGTPRKSHAICRPCKAAKGGKVRSPGRSREHYRPTDEHRMKVAASRIGVTYEEYRAHREAGEKWCSGCTAWHPLEAFGVRREAADGVYPICREATRVAYQRWRAGKGAAAS